MLASPISETVTCPLNFALNFRLSDGIVMDNGLCQELFHIDAEIASNFFDDYQF